MGANYTYQSGRAWARRARIAEPDLGFPTAPEINIEERDGSRRLPSQSILDLRLQKNFRFGKERGSRSSPTPSTSSTRAPTRTC